MKSTKKSLILAILAVVISVVMLAGTTFAWFTNSAKNTGNRIKAGILDVDLLMWDGEAYTSIKDGEGDIFDEAANANGTNASLWEPGKTQIVYLAVKNNGSLAIKYNIVLKVTDNGLADALEYAILDGVDASAEGFVAPDSWETVKGIEGVQLGQIEEGVFEAASNGVLDEITNGTEGETQYFAFAVHMDEEASNEYQGKDIVIDVTVSAGQYTSEYDSFSNQYDAKANEPVVVATPENVSTIFDNLQSGTTVTLSASDTSYGAFSLPEKLSDVTIVAEFGAKADKVVIPANAEIKNVTVKNIDFKFDTNTNCFEFGNGAKVENVKFENCGMSSEGGDKYRERLLLLSNNIGDVTFENCDFNNIGRGVYASSGGFVNIDIKFINTTIKNSNSWVCQCNGGAKTITFDGCTLNNVFGIAKATGTTEAITFTNNTVIGQAAHTKNGTDFFGLNGLTSATVSGNTLDGVEWVPGSAQGIKLAN